MRFTPSSINRFNIYAILNIMFWTLLTNSSKTKIILPNRYFGSNFASISCIPNRRFTLGNLWRRKQWSYAIFKPVNRLTHQRSLRAKIFDSDAVMRGLWISRLLVKVVPKIYIYNLYVQPYSIHRFAWYFWHYYLVLGLSTISSVTDCSVAKRTLRISIIIYRDVNAHHGKHNRRAR